MTNIYTYDQLNDLIEVLNNSYKSDKSITGLFANPPHAGHIDLIRDAKKRSALLIVAINNDAMSILKHGYSFMSWKDRVAIFSEFKSIDYIIENPFYTMTKLLEVMPVSRYLKGGDVTEETMLEEEKNVCKNRCIEIVYGVGGNKSQSSSILLENYWRYRHSQHEFIDCFKKLKDI